MTNESLPPADSRTQPPRPRPSVPTLAITAGIGLILGIAGTLGIQAAAGVVSALTPTPSPTPTKDTRLYDAFAACGGTEGLTLGDDDTTLTIDMKGKEDYSGASYETEQCILRYFSAPSSVMSHIGQTTSMDGRQTESWDGITIAWSYHPDRGADMVIKLDEPKA